MKFRACGRNIIIGATLFLTVGAHLYSASPVSFSGLKILESKSFSVSPGNWEIQTSREADESVPSTFAEAIYQWGSLAGHLSGDVLQSEIEKRISSNRHVELRQANTNGLILEIEILTLNFTRKGADPRKTGVSISSTRRLGDPSRGGYSVSHRATSGGGFDGSDRNYYPAVNAVIEITTPNHEVLWSRTLTISPFDERLRGFSQTSVRNSPARIGDTWRKLCIELSTEIVRRLASERKKISRAVTSPPPIEVRELPAETRVDGHWLLPQAPMQRPIDVEYPFATGNTPSGYVLLGVFVAEDGRVNSVEIVESEPTEIFDQFAMAALLRSRFVPAIHDGSPVNYVTWSRLNFAPPK